MNLSWNRLKTLPFYPFLLAVYPALALLGHNIAEIRLEVAFRALSISLLLALLLLLIFRLVFRQWDAAALAASVSLLLFFTYGQVYAFLKSFGDAGLGVDRHRYLAPLWLGVWLIFLVWLWRKKPDLKPVQGYLNLVAVCLLIFPLFQLFSFGLREGLVNPDRAPEAQMAANLTLPEGQPAPDIYYIILDAYTRDDTLASEYGLDNSAFLDQLKQLGFYVAACSQSNYAQTQLSLASSLNFDYLEALNSRYNAGNNDRTGLPDLIQHSRTRQALEELGYQTVAFETGFKISEWVDADLYLSPTATALSSFSQNAGLNDFELMLVNTSAGRLLTDAAIKLPEFLQADFENPRRIHRERILFDLEQLAKLPAQPGPKFVFAHLVIPHPPYVFGPNGEFIDYDPEKRAGYRDQVIYLNSQLIPLMEKILADSATPPIIILQGDHGGVEAPPAKRMDILNAYYLPNSGARSLYPAISPVNTFRVILNTTFGGHFPLLDDTSLFSVYKTPFEYTVIPNHRSGCP
jgi:hypothetical protein